MKLNFLCELKEDGLIEMRWNQKEDNPFDLFTKNLGGDLFDKHTKVYCGSDEYNGKHEFEELQGESDGGHRAP